MRTGSTLIQSTATPPVAMEVGVDQKPGAAVHVPGHERGDDTNMPRRPDFPLDRQMPVAGGHRGSVRSTHPG